MIVCDLCDQAAECQPKEIENKEYDICDGCWNRLAEKLKGKGRVKKERQSSFLSPSEVPEPMPEAPSPAEAAAGSGEVGRSLVADRRY